MESIVPISRPLVVLNPTANRGNVSLFRSAMQRRLEHIDAEYVETLKAGEATKLAKMAADHNRSLIIIGGDGTVNEAVMGIMQSGNQIPLGIVPAGSGNDFACNTLGISRNPAIAIETALRGSTSLVDVGVVNSRYFINSFSVGLDGEIAATANHLKRYPFIRGFLLYYMSTLRHLLFNYGVCPWLHITIDNQAIENGDFKRYVLVAVMNGPTYGAGFRVTPKANYHDGKFSICATHFPRWLRAIQLLPLLQKGLHENKPEFLMMEGGHVQIECLKLTTAQVDGEILRDRYYDIQLFPDALMVRVPE
jgi:diacylglycerol kinase (ATP)